MGTEVGVIVVANLPGLTRLLLGAEASPEQPRAVAESPMPSSQKGYLYSAGNAGGSRGRSDPCDTLSKADMSPLPWLRKSNVARTAQTSHGIT